MGKLSDKLDEFVERQQIVSAEFCKLVDQVEQFEEYNNQLVDKVKLLDVQKQNAELKLKDILGVYREMKEALEFYAENDHVAECLEPYTVRLEDSEYNWGYETGKLNRAEQALKKINGK